MEAVQQDQDPFAQPGTARESNVANDGNELEAQGTTASLLIIAHDRDSRCS